MKHVSSTIHGNKFQNEGWTGHRKVAPTGTIVRSNYKPHQISNDEVLGVNTILSRYRIMHRRERPPTIQLAAFFFFWCDTVALLIGDTNQVLPQRCPSSERGAQWSLDLAKCTPDTCSVQWRFSQAFGTSTPFHIGVRLPSEKGMLVLLDTLRRMMRWCVATVAHSVNHGCRSKRRGRHCGGPLRTGYGLNSGDGSSTLARRGRRCTCFFFSFSLKESSW